MTWVIVYFQVVSLALALGMQPSDLRLLTGLFVLIMLGMPGADRAVDGLRQRDLRRRSAVNRTLTETRF
jgi:putative tryptophan/tyrosine transport system permease protein